MSLLAFFGIDVDKGLESVSKAITHPPSSLSIDSSRRCLEAGFGLSLRNVKIEALLGPFIKRHCMSSLRCCIFKPFRGTALRRFKIE